MTIASIHICGDGKLILGSHYCHNSEFPFDSNDGSGHNCSPRWIQGGCSGIGLATTQALLNAGATVYIADVIKTPAELECKANLHVDGKCDITSREACKRFIDSIPGNLDGLVNCAGICPVEGKMADDELFARIMSINVTGSWYMGTEAIQRMTQQKQHSSEGLLPGSERTIGAGVIVNIASGASLRGIAGLGAYCTSKHAVLGMTRSWAKEWPTLRVNAVAPGKKIPKSYVNPALTSLARCDGYTTL